MVRHIVLWKLKDELSTEEKNKVKKELKEGMEGSTVDVLLETVFENEAALKVYAGHPDHVAVGIEKIKPFMAERICYDYEF